VDPLRTPNLADDMGDLDRRLRIVEFGDPYDVNSRISNVPLTIKQLTDPALQTTFNNDGLVSNYTLYGLTAVQNWLSVLSNFVGQTALWYVHQHEWALHPPSGAAPSNTPNPGTPPPLNGPAWPNQPTLQLPVIILP
jgi:hypothetical protein